MATGAKAKTPETNSALQRFGRERFSPGSYTLDISDSVWNLPLTMNGQTSTFGNVYRKLSDSRIKETKSFREHSYVTEEGEIHLDGEIKEWPLRATMRELAALFRQGIDPHTVTWFYYDDDWSRDADERHVFFAVHDAKIVIESCSFSSEEPLILKRREDDESIWRSHPYFDEAFERFCYRKFYTETLTGQLMVLRSDEPILYHYERPQYRDTMRETQIVTVVKMYRLLWVALPLLVAVAFPSLRDYMAIAALALAASFLWLCWDTRKAGKP